MLRRPLPACALQVQRPKFCHIMSGPDVTWCDDPKLSSAIRDRAIGLRYKAPLHFRIVRIELADSVVFALRPSRPVLGSFIRTLLHCALQAIDILPSRSSTALPMFFQLVREVVVEGKYPPVSDGLARSRNVSLCANACFRTLSSAARPVAFDGLRGRRQPLWAALHKICFAVLPGSNFLISHVGIAWRYGPYRRSRSLYDQTAAAA